MTSVILRYGASLYGGTLDDSRSRVRRSRELVESPVGPAVYVMVESINRTKLAPTPSVDMLLLTNDLDLTVSGLVIYTEFQ